MSKNINVNPDHYKVAGRERQGEDIVQSEHKAQFTEAHHDLEQRARQRSESIQRMTERAAARRGSKPARPAAKKGAKKAAPRRKAAKASSARPAKAKRAKQPAKKKAVKHASSKRRPAASKKRTASSKRPARKK